MIFSSSTSGVLTCLAANRRSIGYMDADQVVSFNPGGANDGLAYVVRVDGGLANDPSLTDPKRDLKCGKYAYWAGWRLNRRTTSEGAAVDALAAGLRSQCRFCRRRSGSSRPEPTGRRMKRCSSARTWTRVPLIWKAGNSSRSAGK